MTKSSGVELINSVICFGLSSASSFTATTFSISASLANVSGKVLAKTRNEYFEIK